MGSKRNGLQLRNTVYLKRFSFFTVAATVDLIVSQTGPTATGGPFWTDPLHYRTVAATGIEKDNDA